MQRLAKGWKQRAATAAILAAFTVPVFAQFAVIDVSAIAKAIDEIQMLTKQYSQMVSQYNELVTTYNMISSVYGQIIANARGLGQLPQRFIAPFTHWSYPKAGSRYGTSSAWVNALLSGSNATGGYRTATEPLSEYDWTYISPEAQIADSYKYSTVELTDGLVENSMATVGSIRANEASAAGAISLLESNTDGAEEDPSEVQALQNIGSANIIALRNQQDTNQLLASLLETQTLAQKGQRDSMASSIASEIAFSDHIATHYAAMFGPDMQQGVDATGIIP